MLKDREYLEKVLLSFLNDANTDSGLEKDILDYMKTKGYAKGDVQAIIAQNISLQQLSKEELGILSVAIYESKKDTRLKLENNFSPTEIVDINNFEKNIKNEDRDIILKNVLQLSDRQWVCSVSVQEIYRWFNHFLINYNFETQRQATRVKIGDTINTTITINKNAIQDITKEMLEGTFIGNTITLNIRRTGEEIFQFNNSNNTIIIPYDISTKKDILDGYHRCMAVIQAIRIKPDLDLNMILSVLNVDERTAKDHIVREDKHTPIDKEHIRLISSKDEDMEMVKDIARQSSNNELFNKIAKDLDEIKFENKYVTFFTLSDAIKFNFEFDRDNARQIRRVKEFLVNGFNEIIGIYKDNYKLDELKNSTVSLDNNTFIGYVALLSGLYNKENWENELENILLSIDFNRNNELWHAIGIDNDKINKTVIKKISNYFKDLIIDRKGVEIK